MHEEFTTVAHPEVETVGRIPVAALSIYEELGWAEINEEDVPQEAEGFVFDTYRDQLVKVDEEDSAQNPELTDHGTSNQEDDMSAPDKE